MRKYNNKFRIESTRLQKWDYRNAGVYYITICTQNREYYFGEILNDKMQLSSVGVIANTLWYEIINHSNNVALDEFVVMPNHIHGILILDNDKNDIGGIDEDIDDDCRDVAYRDVAYRDVACNVSTGITEMTLGEKNEFMSTISPKSGSVGRIIGSYKSAVTKYAHKLGFDFAWQSRFYEHIIRNQKSLQKIQDYIINNPKNWENDKLNNRL